MEGKVLPKCFIYSIIFFVIIISKLFAQSISFSEYVLDGNFDSPTGIYIADINGDGKNDVVSTSSTLNQISWWRNDGGNPVKWSKFEIDNNFDGAIYVIAEDIDGDSLIDIAAAAWVGNEVSWWKNEGGSPIRWTKQVIDSTILQAHEVYSSDLDKDNDIDIIAASAQDNSITWYRNDGGSPIYWTKQTISNAVPGARSVSVNDIDGDGINDVVSAALLSHEVSWWRNDGNNLPNWTKKFVANNFHASHKVSTVDFEDDLDYDILGVAFTSQQISWWLNEGGDPISWTKVVVDNNFPGAVIAYSADFDFDGDLDVAGTAQGSNQIAWWSHDSSGQNIVWTKHMLNQSFAGAWPMYIGDLDGDTDFDIVSGGNAAGQIRWWKNSYYNFDFEAFPNSGHFPLEVHFSESSHLIHPITTWEWDFTNDGVIDSYDQNPSWIYNSPGNYSVKLIIHYNSITDTLIKENYINVFDGESALRFNNRDSYVICPASPSTNLTDSLTLEAWIKPTGWGENSNYGYGRIIDKQKIKLYLINSHPSNNDNCIFLLLNHAIGSVCGAVTQDNSIKLNEWQHIAFSFNSFTNLIQIYINGIPQVLRQIGLPLGTIADNSADNLFIGNDASGNSTFDGSIDEVRLWNSIRSEQDIQDYLDETLTGNESGLVAYWNMNEGFGDSLNDISNNGNNSNVFNCDWTTGTTFSPVGFTNDLFPESPDNIFLKQNYPNPFNSETIIKFKLFKSSNIIVNIYNTKGQIIKSLLNKNLNSGEYNIKWKGKDDKNQDVSSGLYFYQIQTENIQRTGKMLLIK